jgi:ATP-dependent helicase HrpA
MDVTFSELESQIEQAMLGDRFRLRKRLRDLRRKHREGKESHHGSTQLATLARQIADSQARREKRAAAIPAIQYAGDLPIHEHVSEIARAIQQHQVVILCGETGSGKSTQLPKICLEMGRGVAGLIGHTQPRRLAARSIAARLAEELRTSVGGAVGFKIRFTDATQPSTYIKLMTDGILLAETQGDRFLEQYDTIILDEAHERSLNIDFLLGYLHRLLPRRPELRLIVTSATIDAERFREFFTTSEGPPPVLEVSGRGYPVEMRYRPPPEADDDQHEADWIDGIVGSCEELLLEGDGDILVFLPTERHIRDSAKVLRGASRSWGKLDILPLYARLPSAEQQKIFHPGGSRRIVLATNVAESSLTVPRIHNVIDTGLARISRYSTHGKVQRLPIEPISRASADQRAGRCGRLGPGICIRLYSQDDYQSRDPYATPEVRRSNLASVILQTQALNLGPAETFPFLDPPQPDKIRDGYRTLFELGAMDDQRQLTPLGRRLARLPVDPRIGRMLIAAEQEGCLAEILVIAAALETQDPRDRPVEHQQAADEAHAQHADERSDFLAYLNLWDFYHHLRESLSRSQLQKACRQNFLSWTRLREWSDIYRQLLQLVDQLGMKRESRREDFAAIHRALMTGLLSGIAYRTDVSEYTGSGGAKFVLWPGSSLFKQRPVWVMAAELVETSRRYLRTVAKIEPEWIEPLADHLVKRSYSDPHWSGKRGEAMVHERVTLFGMPIVARRRARLAPHDPVHARELLLRHGLVEGDIRLSARFLEQNRQVRTEVESLASKTRRRDLLFDEENCYRFYDNRVPADVTDVASLEKWRKQAEREQPHLLRMEVKDLLDSEKVAGIQPDDFPELLEMEESIFPLEYRFEPGDRADGITLTIPAAGLPLLHEDRLGWLVPGLLEEKLLALIRSLPKQARRNFVPAPDAARRIASQLPFAEGPFLATVARALSQDAGEPITPEMFQLDKLPAHLHVHVQVRDDQGKVLAEGRDLKQLRRELGVSESAPLALPKNHAWKREGLKEWDWESLPEKIEVQRGGLQIPVYPAIVDEGDTVGLDVFGSSSQARHHTFRGLRRLAWRQHQRALEEQVKWLPHWERFKVYAVPLKFSEGNLRGDLALLICDLAFCGDPHDAARIPRDPEAYRRWLKQGKGRITLAAQDVAPVMVDLFESYHQVRLALEKAPNSWRSAVVEMRDQLTALLPVGFLIDTPWVWLKHYPRYLKAMRMRLEKLSGNLPRDQKHQAEIAPWWDRWKEFVEGEPQRAEEDPEAIQFRWMIEELRVSLFAQSLGVSLPVSAKRLEKQWSLIRDGSPAT